MQTTQVKIIYAVLAVLIVGQAVTVFTLLHIGTSPASTATGQTSISTANQPDLAGVVVGTGGLESGPSVAGTITHVANGSFQIKDDNGSTDTFTTSSNTKVQILGAYKDRVTQQKELDAYNAQVAALMKDPQKNKAALAALQQPSVREVTAGTLSDLAVGNVVAVFTDGSSNRATLINISTNVAPPIH